MNEGLYAFTTIQHNFYAWHAINNSYLSCRHPSLFGQFIINSIILVHALSLNLWAKK